MYNNIEYFETRGITDEQYDICGKDSGKEECFVKINKDLEDKMKEATILYNKLIEDNSENNKKQQKLITDFKNIQEEFVNGIPNNKKIYEL